MKVLKIVGSWGRNRLALGRIGGGGGQYFCREGGNRMMSKNGGKGYLVFLDIEKSI